MAVVGHVGAGKSSLVSALLGEMNKTEGRVVVNVRNTIFKYLNVSIIFVYLGEKHIMIKLEMSYL